MAKNALVVVEKLLRHKHYAEDKTRWETVSAQRGLHEATQEAKAYDAKLEKLEQQALDLRSKGAMIDAHYYEWRLSCMIEQERICEGAQQRVADRRVILEDKRSELAEVGRARRAVEQRKDRLDRMALQDSERQALSETLDQWISRHYSND